mgnify:CR=1 FL=1
MAGHRKALFLTILALAWPTLLEQMLQTLVQYIDAAMVGRIGAEATATVGMSTSVTWLVNGPLFAMGIGFMAFISREMGAEAFDNVKRASVQAVIVTVVTGIGVGVLTLAVSPILPTWMGVDPAIKRMRPSILRSSAFRCSSAVRSLFSERCFGQWEIQRHQCMSMFV